VKFLLAQPAILRFQWELDVVLTNIRSLDKQTPIVILFTQDDMGVVEHIRSRYDNIEVHSYPDEREQKGYHPTVRPFLIWRYLSEDPSREKETYFQIDSDIIFREMVDFSKFDLSGQMCYASDCGGYIDYNYLETRQRGHEIVEGFASLLNIPVQLIKDTPGGGAQWIYSNPTAALFWHTWKDCDILYDYLVPLQSDIQKWTAEMWAQLYNLAKFGWQIKIDPELDFCRPTDDVKMWSLVKILHNAGVVGESAQAQFYKGNYDTKTPFGEDLSWVRRDKAGIKYAEAIGNVVL
jgi:hypothetical protein